MYEEVKDYFKSWQMHQDAYDTNIKSQEEWKSQITDNKYAYYYVALVSNWRFDNDIKWPEHHSGHYKSLAMFRLISFTPMTVKGGIFTDKRIDTYPSLILETMDGRRFEALEPRISHKFRNTATSSYMVYTDDVLRELEKNFVHPEMKLNKKWMENFHFIDSSDSDRGWQHIYTESRGLPKAAAADLYEKWEKEKPILKYRVQEILNAENYKAFERQQKAREQQSRASAC